MFVKSESKGTKTVHAADFNKFLEEKAYKMFFMEEREENFFVKMNTVASFYELPTPDQPIPSILFSGKNSSLQKC